MLKEPRPGRVKTRLGRDIGMSCAAWWFRHQALSLLRRLHDPRWEVVLAVSPDREGLASRVWPTTNRRIPQGPGDLGERMTRILRRDPGAPLLIVGADIPALDSVHIARALTALKGADGVIGPATDGGYWLIGRRAGIRPPRSLLNGVRWSSEHARADTLARLASWRVALTDTLPDVDTLADLPRARVLT